MHTLIIRRKRRVKVKDLILAFACVIGYVLIVFAGVYALWAWSQIQ
jgi:hypothetical protein